MGVEVLIPDFGGSVESLKIVIAEKPDTLNHNLETVPRLYPLVRPNTIYKRSLELLKRAKEFSPEIITKSGLMLGLGEEWDEVVETMSDLRGVDCDILTLGQYLSPGQKERLTPTCHSEGAKRLPLSEAKGPKNLRFFAYAQKDSSGGVNYLPIKRYYHPEEFKQLKIEGEKMGFKHVESGPLVRSSYHAAKAFG